MTTGTGVFVLTDQNTLVAMQPASFASEDDFQELLAAFPELLAGDQIDTSFPRRFALVSREQPISDQEGGSGRWSVDHLFLDQDGIPTLVEVKRSTDTRIRREVVGQMLDYAANSVLHWPVEELRASFGARCEADGFEVETVLAKLLSAEGPIDAEAFWGKVRTNLLAGRVRLIFVADRIPPELRRVVEFLNRQMQPAEVLALELRQFAGQGLKTLVPIVLGQTEEAIQRKGGSPISGPKREWDETSILAALATALPGDPDSLSYARRLLAWARERADRVEFNTNPRFGSFTPVLVRGGISLAGPFRIWTDGLLSISFEYMLTRPVFSDRALREELRRRLNEVPGIDIPESAIDKRPSIRLSALAKADGSGALLEVMDWFAATYRGEEP
ncbi:hypothetical protein [uncultured Enterovirga sp.]|uniref:hypothetical protein n=1 Tax=uncultured Enterovirga sp. TaxID=2026352 RepID=UPI0035C9DCB7